MPSIATEIYDRTQFRRDQAQVLIVTPNRGQAVQLRQMLNTLGFRAVTTTRNHSEGLERLREREISHILFDAKHSDIESTEFVEQATKRNANAILVAVSTQPRLDDVFSLLQAGARHFLVIPFSAEAIEEILIEASLGPPLSENVLFAEDRNEALVEVVLNNLYRVAVIMRQARQFKSAEKEVPKYKKGFEQAADMARWFCEGDEDMLVELITNACIERAKIASTRLGKMRLQLRKEREQQAEK